METSEILEKLHSTDNWITKTRLIYTFHKEKVKERQKEITNLTQWSVSATARTLNMPPMVTHRYVKAGPLLSIYKAERDRSETVSGFLKLIEATKRINNENKDQ